MILMIFIYSTGFGMTRVKWLLSHQGESLHLILSKNFVAMIQVAFRESEIFPVLSFAMHF